MITTGYESTRVSKLAYCYDFQNLEIKFSCISKLSYAIDKKWEIKLCISVNIYCRLPKLGMSTHVFKISLCYDKKW